MFSLIFHLFWCFSILLLLINPILAGKVVGIMFKIFLEKNWLFKVCTFAQLLYNKYFHSKEVKTIFLMIIFLLLALLFFLQTRSCLLTIIFLILNCIFSLGYLKLSKDLYQKTYHNRLVVITYFLCVAFIIVFSFLFHSLVVIPLNIKYIFIDKASLEIVPSLISAIAVILGAIWFIYKYFNEKQSIRQETKHKQFLEIANKIASDNDLKKANAINSITSFLDDIRKIKHIVSYEDLKSQFIRSNPYGIEVINLIFNTITHLSPNSEDKNQVISQAVSQTLSAITEKTFTPRVLHQKEKKFGNGKLIEECMTFSDILDLAITSNNEVTCYHKKFYINKTSIIYFENQVLENANLDHAYFAGANFLGSCMGDCSFDHANFNHAYLKGTIFYDCNFFKTDLNNCNLENTLFINSVLDGTKLDNAFFYKTTFFRTKIVNLKNFICETPNGTQNESKIYLNFQHCTFDFKTLCLLKQHKKKLKQTRAYLIKNDDNELLFYLEELVL